MTHYWWTHWFWITAVGLHPAALLLLSLPPLHSWPTRAIDPPPSLPSLRPAAIAQRQMLAGLLNTSPFHMPEPVASEGGADREPLSFPRPAEAVDNDDGADMEDVFNGRSMIQAAYREDQWLSTGRDTMDGQGRPGLMDADLGLKDATTTRRPQTEDGSQTTRVPVGEIIATRLSTQKRPNAAVTVDMANVTRVNSAMIRSTTRINKSANIILATPVRSIQSATATTITTANIAGAKSISATNSTDTKSINTSISPEPSDDNRMPAASISGGVAAVVDPIVSSSSTTTIRTAASVTATGVAAAASDEDRHNYTNELGVLPVAGAGKLSNEKAPAGRQSKVLSTSNSAAADEGGQQQQRTALDANLVNFTGASKSLLVEMGSPMAMKEDSGSVSQALPVKRSIVLDAGAISGICIAALALCTAVGAGGMVLYRRRLVNKPQTLSEPDSSGYIDDSINRDNSDEMYSLDNDSFLNSLEAMTIQNYWTENVKHTKL